MFSDGEKAREEALTAVDRENWREAAIEAFHETFQGGEIVMGEDICEAIEKIIGPPHHYNARGALIMRLIRSGDILQTNDLQPSKPKHKHAHRSFVYVIAR